MPMSAPDLAIGLAIAVVFLAPAFAWPTLAERCSACSSWAGRRSTSSTHFRTCLPPLEALVVSSTVPLYPDIVQLAVAWHVDAALVSAVIAFEVTAGTLTMWRGPLARVGLLLAAAWVSACCR